MERQDSQQAWEARFPDAPAAELARFRRSRSKPADAKKLYEWYRTWRKTEGRPDKLRALAETVEDRLFIAAGGETPGGDRVILVEGQRADVAKDPLAYGRRAGTRRDRFG